MHNEDTSVSVEEMIRRYKEELLRLKQTQAVSAAPISIQNETFSDDEAFPNVQRDLENLRQNAVIVTDAQAENNAVDEQYEGQTATPATPPPTAIPAFPVTDTDGVLLPPSNPPPREMSTGYLRGFVTTARGALPVPDAQMIITRTVEGEELLEQAVRTDQSGYTPLLSLPAVSSIYSQSPDNAEPFTYYTAYVRATGFYPLKIEKIPLYGGVTSIQPVDLIPVSEGDDDRRERTVTDGAPENL